MSISMENTVFDARQTEKLKKLLSENECSMVGIALRLAWRAGLRRSELHALRWEQVDFKNGSLRLADREIPMEEELSAALERWRSRCGDCGPYVMCSAPSRKQLACSAISRMAGAALARAGIENIGFVDLRHDYILRQFSSLSREQAALVTGKADPVFRKGGGRGAAARRKEPSAEPPSAPALENAAPMRADGKWFAFDDATVERIEGLLASELCSGGGVVLRLAWRTGLLRDEIFSLQWEQVDLENGLLRLSDREVPMDEETAACLRQWQILAGRYGPYLAVSLHKRTHMRPQAISRLARDTLDRAGLTEVRLADLHYNYILRQAAQRGWQQTLRNSGLSISTYRGQARYKAARSRARVQRGRKEAPAEGVAARERLRVLLRDERSSPAAVALWLYCGAGLRYTEITELTWQQVELADGTVSVGGRRLPMTAELTEVLRDAYQARRAGDDPHVLLSARSRKPMALSRLSNLTQGLLVQYGLDHTLLQQMAAEERRNAQREKIAEYAERHEGISAKECMGLLGIPERAARALLSRLAAEGELTRDHRAYRPVGARTTAAQREAAIREQLSLHGPCGAAELSAALGMAPRMIQRALEPMLARGEAVKERAKGKNGALLYALRDGG